MPSAYQKMVEEFGEDYARAEMRRRRGLVKNIPGGAFRNKKFAKAAGALGGAVSRKKKHVHTNRADGRTQANQQG